MDEAITQYLKRKYNLLIGERTAGGSRSQLGSAFPLKKPLIDGDQGAQPDRGHPKHHYDTDDGDPRGAGGVVATIINAVRVALERTPPELSADIVDRGIVLTGGGALLTNLDQRIRDGDRPAGRLAEDPLASVVLGTGRMLEDIDLLRKVRSADRDDETLRSADRDHATLRSA